MPNFLWLFRASAGEQFSSPLRRYGSALLIVLVAILLRYWLDPVLTRSGFVLFLAAILAAAWVGGLGPSLIAQTMILLAEGVWFSHSNNHGWQFSLQAVAGMVAFYGVGITVALLSESRHAARARARSQQHDALTQREHLRATLSCIGDGVLVADVLGRLTWMNPVAESLTGWSLSAAKQIPLSTIFAISNHDSQSRLDSPVHQVLRQSHTEHKHQPVVLATKDGRQLPVSYTAAPIWDANGSATGVVLIFRDESDRRRDEQALRNADRRKDEFLATLAHELRNPLAPICMGLEVLKLSANDPQGAEEVRCMMERQTQHMVRLIDDLLDVSRITRGKLELRKCHVELAGIVQNAIDATRPLIDEAGHRLTVSLPKQPVLLHVDPNRLTQILSNLLNNAAKYTPPGGCLGLTANLQAQQIAITVWDNGLGIPPDRLEFVFKMFARVNGAIERGHTGLGIGLTLVKRLTEMHGGSVKVESAGQNRGSQFSVFLPLAVEQPATIDSPSSVAPHKETKSRRILVVDDNEDALRTLSIMVRILGHNVCTARDGFEALEVAQAFQPEIVLMDLGMPNLNGYEAVRRIRQEPWGQDMVVIATTGWGQEEDRRRTREAGFDHHLVKPVDPAVLRELLDNSPIRPAAPSQNLTASLAPIDQPEPSLN